MLCTTLYAHTKDGRRGCTTLYAHTKDGRRGCTNVYAHTSAVGVLCMLTLRAVGGAVLCMLVLYKV